MTVYQRQHQASLEDELAALQRKLRITQDTTAASNTVALLPSDDWLQTNLWTLNHWRNLDTLPTT